MSKSAIIESLMTQIEAIESGDSRHAAKSPSGKREFATEGPEPAESDKALKRIIAWVNVSERSQHSVRERLSREGFDEVAIDIALSKAVDYGFVDDMRFAASFIRSRLSQGKGEAGIRRELASHEIDIDEVPGWPYDFKNGSDDEFDRAFAYIEKHPPRSKNKREGAYRKLIQRGYASSVASSVARQWAESIENGE